MNKSLISDWHNLSKFQITEDVLTKRCDALEEILVRGEKSYWIDMVRLFLDLKPEEKNVTHFVNAFQTNDDSFPRLKIEKLTKVLAAIALTCKLQEAIAELNPTNAETAAAEEEEEEEAGDEAEYSEEEVSNSELSNIISSALMNATFLKQIKIETKIPVIQTAIEFLSKYSSEDRIIEVEEHEGTLAEIEQRMSEEEEALDAAESLSVVRAAQALLKANNVQNEEINILWWLFGEYSEVVGEYFSNVDRKAMSIIAARELHDISQFATEMPASKHILRKVLALSKIDKPGNNSFSVKDCLESLSAETKKRIVDKYEDIIDELTPCLNALIKSDEKGGLKNIKLNIGEKLDLGVLSAQFYKELTFLSAI